MDISKAWGFGAVIIPKRLFSREFVFIEPTDPAIHSHVGKALAHATQYLDRGVLEKAAVEGVLAASVVQMVEDDNEFGLSVFAAALSLEIDHRFWVVNADVGEAGVTTKVQCLTVATVDAAVEAYKRLTGPLELLRFMRDAFPTGK